MTSKSVTCGLVFTFAALVVVTGCDPITPVPEGDTRVYTLLRASDTTKATVDNSDIESFVVTVTQIALDRQAIDANDKQDDAICTTLLSGDFVLPNVTTGATGVATFHRIEGGVRLAVEHNVTGATAVSVRVGSANDNGDSVLTFTSVGSPAEALLTDAQYNTFISTPHYITVSSVLFPGGEIRGNIQCLGLDDEGGEEIIFTGRVDVDLKSVASVAALLSQAEIPAGTYSKVRLSIENPRLVLADDPGTVITNIHTTANGRLFVSETFVLPEGQNTFLVIDVGDIRLVERGNGGFNLTPQLAASINVLPETVVLQATVQEVDVTTGAVVVAIPGGELVVNIADETQIFLGNEPTPTGVFDSLVVGSRLEIRGQFFVQGSIDATVITVL